MSEDNKVFALLLASLEAVREEIKEIRSNGAEADSRLRVLDEKILKIEVQIEAMSNTQVSTNLAAATKSGADNVKWVILSSIGLGLIGLLLKFGFELIVNT